MRTRFAWMLLTLLTLSCGAAAAPRAGVHSAMGGMTDWGHAPPPTGDPDVDFLTMMIPHHEAALEMARLVLIEGTDPLTRRMAEDIIVSQSAEIEAMHGRLAILRGDGENSESFPAVSGTRGLRK